MGSSAGAAQGVADEGKSLVSHTHDDAAKDDQAPGAVNIWPFSSMTNPKLASVT